MSAYNINLNIAIEKLEITRKRLKIFKFILLFNIIGPLLLLYWTYPYGIYISIIALAVMVLIWGSFKIKWKRNYMGLQTIISWKNQGIDVTYEPTQGINKELLKKHDLVPGVIAKTYMSREKISAVLRDSYFEASDFIVTYKKEVNRIKTRIPYFAGIWMTFTFNDSTFTDMKIKKRILDPKMNHVAEINQLLDSDYDNFGYDDLSDDKQEDIIQYLLNYYGGVLIITDQSKIHFIFDSKFINETPDLDDEITDDSLRKNNFTYYSQTYKLAQRISDIAG